MDGELEKCAFLTEIWAYFRNAEKYGQGYY